MKLFIHLSLLLIAFVSFALKVDLSKTCQNEISDVDIFGKKKEEKMIKLLKIYFDQIYSQRKK